MRINDLIIEAGEFSRYRQLGQNPTQLAGHLIKKIAGNSDTAATQKTAAPVRTKNNLGDTTEIKSIIDQVINGQQLDSQSLQALKQFRRKL
jgi:hypothetical protein